MHSEKVGFTSIHCRVIAVVGKRVQAMLLLIPVATVVTQVGLELRLFSKSRGKITGVTTVINQGRII
jgi:hypothetical protein